TSWDVNRYRETLSSHNTGMNEEWETNLKRRYPPIYAPTSFECEPAVVLDRHGNILTWYLPGILKPERQVGSASEKSWRSNLELYCDLPEGMKMGTMSMSPAWFEQGHETLDDKMKVSSAFRSSKAISWLNKSRSTFALIGGILAVTQPDVFDMGMAAVEKLFRDPTLVGNPEHLVDVLEHWNLPFSALS
ncbi:hypothetical protein BDZ97DRAFT_1619087, partial [Flammula alnicola]